GGCTILDGKGLLRFAFGFGVMPPSNEAVNGVSARSASAYVTAFRPPPDKGAKNAPPPPRRTVLSFSLKANPTRGDQLLRSRSKFSLLSTPPRPTGVITPDKGITRVPRFVLAGKLTVI